MNCQELRGNSFPSKKEVIEVLEKYHNHQLPIVQGEKRFAFLEATGLFEVERGNNLRLLNYGDYVLNHNRDIQIEAIKSINCFFEDFNQCTDLDQVCNVLASGDWANYFDACKTISAEAVVRIAGEIIISPTISTSVQPVESPTSLQSLLPEPRRIEKEYRPSSTQRKQPQATSDPEITRILRERRNAWHDLLVQKMKECIEKAGLEPWETDLIDVGVNLDDINQLYPRGFPIQNTYLVGQNLPYLESESPDSLTFIFEMKSSDASIIIDQVRKAVSQLYEYRYRYYSSGQIRKNAVLVIVLQTPPTHQPWLKDYLLFDRHIGVCWLLEDNSKFDCFDECKLILEPLIAS